MIDVFGLLVGLQQPAKAIQDAVCQKGLSLGWNYSCPRASQDPSTPLPPDVRNGMWWAQDRRRVKVGYGRKSYKDTKKLVSRWAQFALPWAQVDPQTSTKPGSPVCVTACPIGHNGVGLWTAVPLKIVYKTEGRWRADQTIEDPSSGKQRRPHGRRFAIGCGTLGGHYLAGEERFTVEWDRSDNSVWYEVYSFSRPDHPLAYVGRPLVRWLQYQYQQQSTRHIAREVQLSALDRSVAKYKFHHLRDCDS